jgi:TetR/AcrR family transcriptional regulator, transcriptional repressor for nem operon
LTSKEVVTMRTAARAVAEEQLLDAAERLLLDRGLRATTMADVAREAGVAKGTVYLYFRSRDELLAGLRSRYLGRYLAPLDRRRGPVRPRVRRLVKGLVEVAAAHRELHHVLFHEAGFSEVDAFRAVRERLVDLLRTGMADGQLAVDDPELTAGFVLHGVHGTLVEVLHGHPRRGRRSTARTLADLVDRALGPP